MLGILLSAVLLLTGLQWLALKPKVVDAVSRSALLAATLAHSNNSRLQLQLHTVSQSVCTIGVCCQGYFLAIDRQLLVGNRLSLCLQVPLDGVSVDYVNPTEKVPKAALQEMRW